MKVSISRSLGRSGRAEKPVSFEFSAPTAKKVQLAGTFNSWVPSVTPLKKDRNGKWTATIKLAPGKYEYRFFVDGNWQNDQRPVECVPNSFGSWNCVVEVS